MAVPLWEIGRLRQLLSCKEMEINRPGNRGWAANFANTHESAKKSLFRVIRDRSSWYFDFTDTADFKRNNKVPHSYSRALPIHAKNGREREPENARLANGVRYDEIKKDYLTLKTALIAHSQFIPIDIRVVYNYCLPRRSSGV